MQHCPASAAKVCSCYLAWHSCARLHHVVSSAASYNHCTPLHITPNMVAGCAASHSSLNPSTPPSCALFLLIAGAAASRLVQPRKPAGKLGGGLGVRKLEAKVDEGLFEQQPAAPEPVKPLPVAAAVAAEAEKPAAASRFAYDTLTAVSSELGCWGVGSLLVLSSVGLCALLRTGS